jgi:hypothetical protein
VTAKGCVVTEQLPGDDVEPITLLEGARKQHVVALHTADIELRQIDLEWLAPRRKADIQSRHLREPSRRRACVLSL